MFAKMKLRQRILLGYLAPLLILLVAMGAVFINLEAMGRMATELENYRNIEIETREINICLSKLQRAARGYLLMRNPDSRQTYDRNEGDFKTHAELLTSRVKDPQQKDTLYNLKNEARVMIDLHRRQMALVDEGKLAEAHTLFQAGEDIKKSRELDDLATRFEQRETELRGEHQQAYDTALTRVRNSIIYGLLGAVGLAVFVALWLAAAISRNITTNATQLSAAASEIAATIAQHERTASQQAAAANETSATIAELTASSRQSAEQAASTAAVAAKASSATAQGGDTTRHTVAAMGNLKEKIGATAEQILHLGEQTSQIGIIATLVKDLAGQINMLALNAAVEAARAGEHGKGFAVVAGEVRKLADQSKKSAEQAAALVADIQKATNSSILMTEEGTRTVAEVTRMTGEVGELFNSLAGMAGSVNENAQQVMLNAKQQTGAFSQVVEAINNIAAGTKETAAGISQTKIGVQKLNEAAENLKAIA